MVFAETDLHNVIERGNILRDIHRRYIIYQVLKAIKYIHSGNVIHRDLKVIIFLPPGVVVPIDVLFVIELELLRNG